MPELAFVQLGSNLDPENHLRLALDGLGRLGRVVRTSQVYQSPAWRRPEQPDYLNAAALVETEWEPVRFQQGLRRIEEELGRVRGPDKFEARTIDLDLALYDGRIEHGEITLPAPDLLERAHVAVPIAELDPEFPHPITGEPLGRIADRLGGASSLARRADIALLIEPR